MGFVQSSRPDLRPFFETADGKELPAIYIIGGAIALVSPDGESLSIDEHSDGLVFQDWVHYQVHRGEMFHAEHSFAGVLNGADVYIRLLTGAKEAHSVFLVGHGGQCLLYLYEAPNINGGTAVPIWNMNRNSLHVPGAAVFHTPNVVGLGTSPLVNGRVLPGGTSPTSRVGGGVRSGTEWELKPATEYLFRANNNSGGTIAISIGVEFYED